MSDPKTVTWRAPNPLDAERALDVMYGEICDEFDDDYERANRLHDLATAKLDRLAELLSAAWEQFVDEAGLTEEHVEEEEVDRG